jgi:hypothetical protein
MYLVGRGLLHPDETAVRSNTPTSLTSVSVNQSLEALTPCQRQSISAKQSNVPSFTESVN